MPQIDTPPLNAVQNSSEDHFFGCGESKLLRI